MPCDVTDSSTLDPVREAAVDAFRGIDVVAASQGAISRESILDVTEEEWDFVTDVALDGVRRVTQAMAPAIGGGCHRHRLPPHRAARDGRPPASTVAKGGVEAFTPAAAKELAPEIRVNAIAPEFVITPQNEDTYAEGPERGRRSTTGRPPGRVTEREGVVGAAVSLGRDAAS